MSIAQFLIQITSETSFLYCGKSVRSEVCFVIDVGDGAHTRTQDDFDVIGKVELETKNLSFEKKTLKLFKMQQKIILERERGACFLPCQRQW